MLLSKLYYSQSRYAETLKALEKVKLLSTTNKTLRNTQLLAEANSLKGLCLEHSKTNIDDDIIKCFETASTLAIDYSESVAKLYQTQAPQQKYSLIQQTDDGFDVMNPLYEIALQKVPVLYIKKGNISTGLERFRDLLCKPHIQSMITIRQSLLKKFGESLLSSVCASNYQIAKYEKRNEK